MSKRDIYMELASATALMILVGDRYDAEAVARFNNAVAHIADEVSYCLIVVLPDRSVHGENDGLEKAVSSVVDYANGRVEDEMSHVGY